MTCVSRAMRPVVRILSVVLCVVVMAGGVACGTGSGDGAGFEASDNARRYPLTGVVRGVKPADRVITVAHDPVEGLMDAMTMDFVVRDAWVLDVVAPGDRVTATLVLDGARSWLEGVAITKADSTGGGAGGVGGELVAPGTPLPDVALVDQDGRDVSTSAYQGRWAVYTFIYTRCPLPDFCPLMMRRLNEVASSLAAQGRRDDVWLLAVTVDPEYDRPPVLKAFGDRMIEAESDAGRYARTALLTGTPEAIRTLASPFQLTYEPAGDEIIHGLRTVVVDPDGRIVRTFMGSDWSAADVVGAIGRSGTS
jgi:protein SCO1/2